MCDKEEINADDQEVESLEAPLEEEHDIAAEAGKKEDPGHEETPEEEVSPHAENLIPGDGDGEGGNGSDGNEIAPEEELVAVDNEAVALDEEVDTADIETALQGEEIALEEEEGEVFQLNHFFIIMVAKIYNVDNDRVNNRI